MLPNRNSLGRALNVGYWVAPFLLALALYWPALASWFQKDDFVWLGLRGLVHSWHDLGWALFAPLAQGTIRTLSERLFFMSFSSIFGLHALPFHCWSFLIFAATLPLLTSVCVKLTGSRAAGFWAAILWTVSSGVAVALSWIAISYELLCAFFFLASLWLLIRYVETGEGRFYIAQCAVFLLGFGVLELNVVYPALAAAYALCCARHVLRKIVPLFVISAAYSVAHVAAARLPDSGPYKMYWDLRVFSTLWTYWKWAMGPRQLIFLGFHPSLFRSFLTAALTLGFAVFLIWKLRRREWVAAFFPAWFLIVLAPLLPLRDHIDLSYLTIPAIGISMWGGWAVVSGWSANQIGRMVAVSLLAIYLCVAVPVARVITVSFYDRSQKIRNFVLGVVDLSRTQPEKMVLLKGVAPEMFWSAVYDRPFGLFGIRDVYLAPEEAQRISHDPQLEDPHVFFVDPVIEKRALDQGRAIVLDASEGRVRDITAEYRMPAEIEERAGASARVDVGTDLVAGQLGPTWYPLEAGFRWMPKRATVKLPGPRAPGQKLYLTGFCPAAALKRGPLQVEVSVDGESLARVPIRQPEAQFTFAFALPPQLVGRSSVEVSVELDRTFFAPPDPRELGLAFGVFEIR